MKRILPISANKRLFGQAATTSSLTLVECKILSAAIPRLKELFGRKSNDDHIFPLFSPQINDLVWQTVKIDLKRRAAVLVPLVSYEGVPSLLFTTRSSHLPTHANEVSFPGGHFQDRTDRTLEETALREAQEELRGDYPWDKVEIIGNATPLPSIRGTPVTPVIGVLPYEISATTFPGDPNEVDEIFCVSLADLMTMETIEPNTRFRSNIPVYPAGENKRIWGLTAVITQPLLHKLFQPVLLQDNTVDSKL